MQKKLTSEWNNSKNSSMLMLETPTVSICSHLLKIHLSSWELWLHKEHGVHGMMGLCSFASVPLSPVQERHE